MKELSLFSGAGGGLLATKHLLGWKTIGYVEIDEYCQAVLSQRIADGYLDPAPIFGDIRRFIEEGYAEAYQGMVDVITAGFPCQPFSIAGKQKGEADERNQWPNTIECLRSVRPRFAFLENVSGLLSSGYAGRIFGDLAEAGYNAKWCVLGADDVGAFHKRKRLWIFAYSKRSRWSKSLCGNKNSGIQTIKQTRPLDIYGSTDEKICVLEKRLGQPAIFGNNDGMAYRVDKLKAIGNGQVPAVVELAWKVLTKSNGH